jgi:hypothetical protein
VSRKLEHGGGRQALAKQQPISVGNLQALIATQPGL